MKIYYLGDIGTTQIKVIIIIDGIEYRFIIPTAIGPSRPLEFGSGEGLSVDNQEYFTGQTAIDYSPNLIWGRDENWLMSDWYKRLHLYCIAKGISIHIDRLRNSHQAFTHLLEQVHNVNLVTAVPYANWQQRNEIAKNLAGEYEVGLLENDSVIRFNITQEIVKNRKGNKVVSWPRIALQGWSAFLANGKPADNPGKPYVVVIGLGGRNIVYCTMKANGNGQYKPVDGLVGSTEGGILNIVENLMSRIERQYRIELNHQFGIEALKSGAVADHDISDMVAEITKPYIDGVLSLISERWNERQLQPFISEIRLTGGGAILLGNRIKHKLIKVDNDPIWSECEGMKAVL